MKIEDKYFNSKSGSQFSIFEKKNPRNGEHEDDACVTITSSCNSMGGRF